MSSAHFDFDVDDPASWPYKTEDGSSARDLPDGGKLFRSAGSGPHTFTWTDTAGETTKVLNSDGSSIEILPDGGGQKQTNADGSTITQLSNGTIVQEKGDVKITRIPAAGITIEENSTLKYKATRFPDGYEMIEREDGLTVDRAPDGTMKATHADGMEVETFEDGSKKVRLPDGSRRIVPPPAHDGTVSGVYQAQLPSDDEED